MKHYFLTLLSLITFGRMCSARLGETEAQIAERYGQPLSINPGFSDQHLVKNYIYKGFNIVVHFLDGKSSGELFSKVIGDMADTEIATLLAANQPNGIWRLISGNCMRGPIRWQLETNNVKWVAYYFGNTHTLAIAVKSFDEWYSNAGKTTNQGNLNGF